MLQYLQNCFLLLIPVLAWNILFYKKISSLYSAKQTSKFETAEKILRYVVFVSVFIMKLYIGSVLQKTGLYVYLSGIVIYFLSWLLQIYKPEKFKSRLFVLAPAYTSFIWLAGIGIIGQNNLFEIPYFSAGYIVVSATFVTVHTLHTNVVLKK